MNQTASNTNPQIEVKGLIGIYKQAVNNVPILRYSWVIIATICILSLAAYFKLNNSDVFFYALLVIIISFLGFLFSYLLKTKEKFVRVLLYLLLSSVVMTLIVAVLGFGTYIIWEKPSFYNRWFPKQAEMQQSDTLIKKTGNTDNDTKSVSQRIDTANAQKEVTKRDSIPTITSKGAWKPAANVIRKNSKLKVSQFELYGIESDYTKTKETFAATGGKEYPTYSLSPYYGQTGHTLAPVPIFNVVLENTSDKEILITKTLYRVSKIGQVMGGNYGLLEPEARYEHILEWKTGDQEFNLVPPFKIPPRSYGSFLLQLKTNERNIGLCWLMKIYFITSNEEGGVSTDIFQLIMTGPNK